MAEPSQVKPAWQRGGAAHTPSRNFQTYVQIFLGFPSLSIWLIQAHLANKVSRLLSVMMKMMTMNFCRSRQPGVEYSTTVDWAGDVLAALEAGDPDAVCLKWGSGLTISEDCVRLSPPLSQQPGKEAFLGQSGRSIVY